MTRISYTPFSTRFVAMAITVRLWQPGPFGSVYAFVATRDVLTDLIPLTKGLMERVERVQRTEA